MTWLLYGANGYTGELIARLAHSKGLTPVLAGRSNEVRKLADELGLEVRVFDLNNKAAVDAGLAGIRAVLHCAGPFSRTSQAMVDACIRNGVNYADITGEIPVFESVYASHLEAEAAGVTLIPGVGFDIVPSDYLLARLYKQLPQAMHADVAIFDRGGFSKGTVRTVLEGMREGGFVREQGVITPVAMSHKVLNVSIDGKEKKVLSIPLGDVSSGFRLTGIPNITNYASMPGGVALKYMNGIFRAILAIPGVYSKVDNALKNTSLGPGERRRASSPSDVFVQLLSADKRKVAAAIRVSNTYVFTAASALQAVQNLCSENMPAGAWTPSQVFGDDFIHTITDIRVDDIACG